MKMEWMYKLLRLHPWVRYLEKDNDQLRKDHMDLVTGRVTPVRPAQAEVPPVLEPVSPPVAPTAPPALEKPQGESPGQPELMTPSEAAAIDFKRPSGGGADILPSMDMMAGTTPVASRVGSQLDHAIEVATAARNQKPVSAVAVDAYGIKLPEGYAREGDQYVPTAEAKRIADEQQPGFTGMGGAVPSEFQSGQTGVTITELTIRNGTINAAFGTEMASIMAECFFKVLRETPGAENYIEFQFHHDSAPGDTLCVTVAWSKEQTPHQQLKALKEKYETTQRT